MWMSELKRCWSYIITNTEALNKYWHQQCERPAICLMPLGIKDLFLGIHDLINHPDELVQVLSALVLCIWEWVVFSLCLCKLKTNQIWTCFGLLITAEFVVSKCCCQLRFADSHLCDLVDRQAWYWSTFYLLWLDSDLSMGVRRKKS